MHTFWSLIPIPFLKIKYHLYTLTLIQYTKENQSLCYTTCVCIMYDTVLIEHTNTVLAKSQFTHSLDRQDDDDDNIVGALVGGVIGGICVAVLLFIILLIRFRIHRKRKRKGMEHVCTVLHVHIQCS